jgi:sortase A
LNGSSTKNLAFASTHVSSIPQPGEKGNSIILCHCDTQFSSLKNYGKLRKVTKSYERLQKSDFIEVKTKHRRQRFKMKTLRITTYSLLDYIPSNINNDTFDIDQPNLTPIICYLFDAVLPDPVHMYIVRAVAI